MKSTRLALAAALALLGCLSPEASAPRVVLRVADASAADGVSRRLVDHFTGAHPEVESAHLSATHSKAALDALRRGECDLACVARDLDAEEAKDLTVVPFARDPIALAVHRSVGVRDLTTRQVRSLYGGEIRDWSALGGPQLAVALLDRPEDSSAKRVLRAAVLSGVIVDPRAAVLDQPELMDDALSNSVGALGYTSLGSARASSTQVEIVRLDGVTPSTEAVKSGAYPLARTFAFVAPREPTDAARAFLQQLGQPGVAARLAAASLVPLHPTVRLGVPPARNIVSVEAKFGALARYLSHKLCRPVELVHQTSYSDLVAGFRNKTLDAALLGSFAYAAVHEQSGVEVLARPEYRGRSHYRGVLYVRAASPYRTVEDLRGRRIALAGKCTTAGELYPEYLLASRGLPPLHRFFSHAFDAGSHEAALRALVEGRVEAAAAKDLVYEEMVREDPALGAWTRPLSASEPVPGDGFGVGPGLGDALKGRLRQVLLTMHETDDGRRALRDMGAGRFVSTSDADYRPVYDMLAGAKKTVGGPP